MTGRFVERVFTIQIRLAQVERSISSRSAVRLVHLGTRKLHLSTSLHLRGFDCRPIPDPYLRLVQYVSYPHDVSYDVGWCLRFRDRDRSESQTDWPSYSFSGSDSDLDTNLTYCNNNHPISVREEVEEAERRRDDDDYFPGIIVIRPGEYSSGTGQVFPEKFTPPNSSIRPQDLFPPSLRKNTTPPVRRFISRLNSNEMLIYTDGACLGNGQANPRAGCGVVFREERPGRTGHFAFALERQGPTGHPRPQTSNRAELRAVIAALQFRIWPGEGWTKIVIATDSEYVVEGATSWIKGWVRNGWRTSRGRPVKNKDLWKCLLGWCEDAAKEKTKLEFWRIPREWNAEADRWAKLAADEAARLTAFIKPAGYLI